MLANQRFLFNIPDSVSYLNCAYQSPLAKPVEEAGKKGLAMKVQPWTIGKDDFFEPVEKLKATFSAMIGESDYRRVAVIPSASYGFAQVANNVEVKPGQEILLVDEQFPSNYYCWSRIAKENGAEVQLISAPDEIERARIWNEQILESINEKTAVVAIGTVHWADGTLFDLPSIREKTSAVGAKLIVDATQSLGAMPFDLQDVNPDALIVAGYKWLMGPYSIGLAWFSPEFDNGKPIENNWINRQGSDDFQNLVNYKEDYREASIRYDVGENSNFILVPMLRAGLKMTRRWGAERIQEYCGAITEKAIGELREMGCQIEEAGLRGNHLFGVRTGDFFDREKLEQAFNKNAVYVSYRGDSVRVSPHVYNTAAEMDKLVSCFKMARKQQFA